MTESDLIAGMLREEGGFQKALRNILDEELGGLDIGTWTKPLGGYFMDFESLPGCARAIVARCKKAGVVLTPAGATWPYGKDPEDTSIRIAPTFPSMSDLESAAKLFTLCVKLVSMEKIMKEKQLSVPAT